MSQYPPQDPNYPYGGQPQPGSTPYPPQSGGYGAPQPPSQYGQQPGYPQYPQYPQAPQPQYPQAPAQPQYPGYGVPGQPSQYGAPAPQSQYGYPQAPGFPGGPGMPPMAPKSNRGTITGISIAAVVVVLVVVGVFVLRNLNGVSVAGQWYGVGHFTSSDITFDAEVFMNLSQSGTNVSGTGKLCINTSAGPAPDVPFSVTGTTNSSGATLQWGNSGSSDSASTFGSNNLTIDTKLSSGTMSLNASDSSGTFTASLQQGSESQYTSGCSQLTPISTGG